MNNFQFVSPTAMYFGDDSIEKLGSIVNGKYKKILLHYGSDRIVRDGLYDRIKTQLDGIEVVELSGVVPNPKFSLVKEGIELAKAEGVDLILAVGGGSVIDSAKAIAAGALYDGDIWECFMGRDNIVEALPVGAILTFPATGSEMSMGTVVTNEENALKRSIDDDLLRPVFAIMDPNTTLSLSKSQTMTGITDIISHMLERYFTNTEDVKYTDALTEAALRTVMEDALILNEDLSNYAARSEIMLSGSIGHNGVLGLGREDDWASHRIGHEITGLYEIDHGVTLSIVFPAWMKYVYKINPARFARFAREVFGIDGNGKTDEELALEGIAAYENFLTSIGMPIRFSEANIPTDEFELMAEKCCGEGYVGNFKKLYTEDVVKVYELAK